VSGREGEVAAEPVRPSEVLLQVAPHVVPAEESRSGRLVLGALGVVLLVAEIFWVTMLVYLLYRLVAFLA
jgi:hypothetical protein